MASLSLSFIMDVDEGQQEDIPPSPAANKRDKEPSAPSALVSRGGQEASFITISSAENNLDQEAGPSSISSPSTAAATTATLPVATATATATASSSSSVAAASGGSGSGKRRAATSNRTAKQSAATTSLSSRPPIARRRSTASTESMDQGGYASSSSMGGGGGPGGLGPPNYPTRPMPPNATSPELPIKLTPITGRVSRAKKGVPVHTCDICKPPKTFTRAEHLRRHQLSHQTPGFPCTYPGCDRAFHRPDLLARHLQKHEQDGDKASSSRGGQGSRRGSSQSVMEAASRMPIQQQGPSNLVPGQHLGAGAGVTGSDMASTSNMSMHHQHQFQHQQNAPGSSMQQPSGSPSMGSHGGYGQPSGRYDYAADQNIVVYPSPDMGNSSLPNQSSLANSGRYQAPRTPATSLYVDTQGLGSSPQLPDNPPGLTNIDASPFASSDSSYSNTPATDNSRNQRYNSLMARQATPPTHEWQPNATAMLSTYPPPPQANAVRDPDALEGIAAPYYFGAMGPSHMPAHHQPGPHNNFYLDVPSMGGFPDHSSHALLGDPSSQAQHHHRHPQTNHSSVSSVRSLSPVTTSTISAETLVTPSPALPTDRVGLLASLGRQKELAIDVGMGAGVYDGMSFGAGGVDGASGVVATHGLAGMGGCSGGGIPVSMPLASTVNRAVPEYLDVYWERFHPAFPIVHQPPFEEPGKDILQCAMAAVATQFMDGKEDRVRGNLLHEFAWQEVKRCPAWNLQIMQAILLCELFARFRGRKAAYKPSRQFESLYSRVLDYNQSALFEPDPTTQQPHMSNQERWRSWVEIEGRRRLLAACFYLDVHTSILHEQPRVRNFDMSQPGSVPPIPLIGNSTPLWDAPTADSWALMLDSDPSTLTPRFFPDWDTLTADDVAAMHSFDRALVLAAEAMRLPKRNVAGRGVPGPVVGGGADSSMACPPPERRLSRPDGSATAAAAAAATAAAAPTTTSRSEENIARVFRNDAVGNTYLALHHTPLYDLLAVSGDSWVFSHKVLPAESFVDNQKRLKAWADSHMHLAAAAAAMGPGGGSSSSADAANSTNGMSASKAAVYAARALVAFLSPRTSTPGGAGSNAASTSGGDMSAYWAAYVCALVCWAFGHRAMRAGEAARGAADEEALAWLRNVAEMRPEEAIKVRARREAFGVVGLVRRRLEAECVGGRSRLFVDAVGVLKKLEEGVSGKRF